MAGEALSPLPPLTARHCSWRLTAQISCRRDGLLEICITRS